MKKNNKIIRWLANINPIMLLRRFVWKYLLCKIARNNGIIIYYNDPERSSVLNLIRKIKKETEFLLLDNEAYQIFMAVRCTGKINGDIAEAGVYKGGSAKLICEAKGDKTLHLFDTFEGLPELYAIDDPKQFHKGQYSVTCAEVKNFLKKYQNVYFYEGLFPSTAEPIKNNFFSFVHLDLDLYEATLNSLEFFYPRMNKSEFFNILYPKVITL